MLNNIAISLLKKMGYQTRTARIKTHLKTGPKSKQIECIQSESLAQCKNLASIQHEPG